ncbi:S41 family peptidase [Hymenobacter lucidus]|uniref:Tail specific protease domain-containing protein n=1 Tax=Hymenobacter lucidus TaxID=2880930 RepID=A0ABS8AST4_9BACT|nr:S41 family peptidase [Hymenobacter lucidus]MCB2409124.1 hypothetical protein [Hymenobacter lucidus]
MLFFITTGADQQPGCGCAQDFSFTVQYLERNLPGFAHTVPPTRRRQYAAFKQQLGRAVAAQPSRLACLKYLTTYVEYFRDSHTSISTAGPTVPEDDRAAVARFLASPDFTVSGTLRVDSSRRNAAASDPLEGYYQAADGTYRVYLTRSKTSRRDYAGVIVAARTRLWRPGQIKFELRRNPDATYQAYQYQRNHSVYYVPVVRFAQGRLLGLGWHKQTPNQPAPPPAGPTADFRMLAGTEVAYLRLPSFAGEQWAQLDSLYRAVAPRILRSKYLIIDVRDNPGGADRNVTPLLPFFYARPIKETQAEEYYVTADNLRRYEEYLRRLQADSARYGSDAVWSFRQKLTWLKQVPLNSFVLNPQSTQKTYTLTASLLPLKVAVLYNRGCASACETLLFWARQPSKAVLVGENSAGFVGYGNSLPVTTPCQGFVLNVSTLRFKNQLAYEETGVAPHIRLRDNEDWLAQTLRILQSP